MCISRLTFKLLLPFGLSFIQPQVSFADTSATWKPIKETRGITVFQRTDVNSDILSLKGETIVQASVGQIIDVLRDNARASAWMPYVAEKRDLRASGQDERIEYTHVDMPWPLKDRYFVNRGKIVPQTGGGVVIQVESVIEPGFEDQDKICGWLDYSNFILTPISSAKTLMTIEVNSDPKGLIPKWLINFAQKTWPIDFFDGMNQELNFRKSKESENLVRDAAGSVVAH